MKTEQTYNGYKKKQGKFSQTFFVFVFNYLFAVFLHLVQILSVTG